MSETFRHAPDDAAFRRSIHCRLLVALCALVLVALPAFSQTSTQQSPTRLDTCNVQATATGAANTAVTVTVTPPSGQFFYFCTVSIFEVANAAVTGAAGPAPIFTTTNLPVNLIWWGDNATQGTGWQKQVAADAYPLTVKTAQPGTAFTIVTSAGQSTQSVRLNVTGYFAGDLP